MKNILYAILSCLIFISFSCASLKKRQETKLLKQNNLQVQTLVKKINQKVNFTTFSATFKGFYKEKGNRKPLKGILKIEQGKSIWISLRPVLGIEIFRVLLTSSEFQVLNKLNNEYIFGSYEAFAQQMGVALNYEMIEKILTGKFFYFPDESQAEKYTYTLVNKEMNTGKLTAKLSETYSHTALIDAAKNELLENSIESTYMPQKRKIEIKYTNRENTSPVPIAKEIELQTFDENYTLEISLNYSNMKWNEQITFPFHVPENYKKTKL